jgi:predicted Ser/Thr protein kinase
MARTTPIVQLREAAARTTSSAAAHHRHFLARGDQFGRYEVRAELGRGSLGRVYRAFDPLTSRAVAIKLMRTAYLPARTVELYRRRFRMEAQAAGGLAHPNIVRIYDQGEDYLVMEFLEGTLLSRRLRGRKLGLEDALSVLASLGSALDYAHAHGVVHRDLQPRNVMLLPDGTPKLTDFGLAVFPGGDATVGGKFLGHPSYLAPEHIVEGRATALSDLFSLGAIAYEMLTGQRAFPGQNVGAIIHRVVYDEPAPPSTLNPLLPAAYDDILAGMLHKEPDRRPSSAEAFVKALALHKVAARPRAPRRRAQRARRGDPRAQDTLDLGRREATVLPAVEPPALVVGADPIGAAVWIDGVCVGRAPVALAQLCPGAHVLRVIAEGFVPVQMTMDAAGAASVLVTLQPQAERADLATSGLGYALERARLNSLGRPS